MHNRLDAIREFEKNYLPYADGSQRPHFHLTGGIGWMNDPNGFSVYKGEYHLFFQYHPYKTEWGLMHWGHAKTRDFIRWERLAAALAPDQEYDRDGCFSGSALELENGKHLLMYTGVCQTYGAAGSSIFFQSQCAAIGDGLNYQKYSENPVIDAELLPEGGSREDFRDPRIWKDENGFHAVIGNRGADESGTVLLYDSQDALHWTYRGILAASQRQYGEMWECPDFFHLSGKDILLISIQGKIADAAPWDPRNRTACLTGTFDPVQCRLNRERMIPVDYGTDFYAPQTLETPDGRRIMIAWMQNWESSGSMLKELGLAGQMTVPDKAISYEEMKSPGFFGQMTVPDKSRSYEGQISPGFFGQMTVPRELTLDHDRLIQLPVRELDSYRTDPVRYQNVLISEETGLPGISGRCLDMTVRIRPAENTELYQWFCIKAASDGKLGTAISYIPDTGSIRVDRTGSGFFPDIENVRDFPVRNRKGALDLRLIMDRYSLELFVNNGEQAASFVLYTPETASAICFACEGTARLDVEKYDLTV